MDSSGDILRSNKAAIQNDGEDPSAKTIIPYSPARSRATWATTFFVMQALTLFVSICVNQFHIKILTNALEDGNLTPDIVDQCALWVGVIALILFVEYVALIMAFLMWFHRVYRNLPALGAPKLETTPGWAVGCWFIPILFLFRPYQAAREVAVYSSPNYQGTRLAQKIGAPGLIKWWWAAWIIGTVLSNGSNQVYGLSDTIHSLIIALYMDTFSGAILLAAAVFGAFVVRRLTRDQDTRHLSMLHETAVST